MKSRKELTNIFQILSPLEKSHLHRCVRGLDELNESTFEKLFEYYCNQNEIPYGVAKARTGDPYDWILNRVELVMQRERIL